MARIPTGVSPDVQSIAQDIAIAEAQRRMTLGQQMAAREQALRQARQLRGADVLRAMAREAEMAEAREVALRQIAIQRALMEEQQKAALLSGLTGAAAAGLIAAEGIERPAEEPKPEGTADNAPAGAASSAQNSQAAKDALEMEKINQQPDPMKRQELMREFTAKQRARQTGGL